MGREGELMAWEGELKPLFSWRGAIASAESPLKPTTRLVLLTLSLHMNEKGGSAWPSLPRLAEETGLLEKTVREHLHLAVRAGWLTRENRPGRTAVFTATLPPVPLPFDGRGKPAETAVENPGDNDHETAGPLPPNDPSRETAGVPFDGPNPSRETVDEDVKRTSVPSGGTLDASPKPFVSRYVTACREVGYTPSSDWKGQAGVYARKLLEDGTAPDLIRDGLERVARLRKQPSTLAHVVVDLQVERHQATEPPADAGPECPTCRNRRRILPDDLDHTIPCPDCTPLMHRAEEHASPAPLTLVRGSA